MARSPLTDPAIVDTLFTIHPGEVAEWLKATLC